MTVAYLKAYAPRYSGHACFWFEIKGELLTHVKGDYWNVESEAGILKGLIGKGSDGDDMVDFGEILKTVGEGGGVGEMDGGSMENMR